MPGYTTITVIYNPNSTHSSRATAKDLAQKLSGQLIPTEYAGHAEVLAYDAATASKHPLIISVSGDGGYNEVVNGILRAGGTATAGLVPAGNANDHYASMHRGNFVKAVRSGTEQCIDLLRLTTTVNGAVYTRYAHSYIGLGFTSKAGHELNKTNLNRLNEMWIVSKSLYTLEPTRLIIDGQVHDYHSLTFSNAPRMARFLSMARSSKLKDGKFEVTSAPARHKFHLLRFIFKAWARGVNEDHQSSYYEFKTVAPTMIQLDGEVVTIDAGAKGTVELLPLALKCIV